MIVQRGLILGHFSIYWADPGAKVGTEILQSVSSFRMVSRKYGDGFSDAAYSIFCKHHDIDAMDDHAQSWGACVAEFCAYVWSARSCVARLSVCLSICKLVQAEPTVAQVLVFIFALAFIEVQGRVEAGRVVTLG